MEKDYPIYDKKPRLVKGKKWYIDYQIWHIQKQTFIRQRHFKGFDNHDNEIAKEVFGIAEADRITKKLNSGWVLGIKPQIIPTLEQGVHEVVQYKAKTLDSIPHQFNVLKTVFLDWAKDQQIAQKFLHQITRQDIVLFLDYCRVERNLGNKSINHYLSSIRAVFAHYISREIITHNPTSKIKKLKEKSNIHLPFDEAQRKAIKEKCIELNEKQLLLFIQFIYYSFVRPAELRRLKIKNIQDGKMLIEAYESKGGRGEYVRI